MKRILVSIFSIMILLGFVTNTSVSAESNREVVNVEIDGQSMELNKVNINIDGKDIEGDMPAISHKGNALVSVRFMGEALGAKVSWDKEEQAAVVKTSDKEIVLPVDSSEAIINGKKKTIPNGAMVKLVSVPFAKNATTMIPFRFIAEELGAKMEWDSDTFTSVIKSKGSTENNREVVNVEIDGQKMELNKINIKIDEKDLEGDMPAVAYKESTLASVRFIGEALGAEVSWNKKKQAAVIKTSDKEIVLPVDSSEAIINGKEKTIPKGAMVKLVSIPSVKNPRTMIPFRFIAEELGAKVEWDNDTFTATIKSNDIEADTPEKPQEKPEQEKPEQEKPEVGINTNKIKTITTKLKHGSKIPEIHIEAEKEINYKDVLSADKKTITIDIADAGMENKINVDSKNNSIKSIKANQLKDNKTVRVTIELKRETTYKVNKDNNNLKVSFVNDLQGIEKETINGKEAIVIKNVVASNVNSFKLSNPSRIVVDLRNTNLNNVKSNINTDIIKDLRLSQYSGKEYDVSEKVARVVLDISDNYENPRFETQERGDDLIIFAEADEKVPLNLQGIEKETINGKEAIVIKNGVASNVNSFKLSNPSRIVLDLRNTNLNNVKSNISTDIIKKLRLSQYSGKEYDASEKVTRVVLDISDSYEKPRFETRERGDDLIIFVEGNKIVPVVPPNSGGNGKTIVIDAGHGGHDGGAAANGLREKDLALNVSLRTRDKLQNLGYNVLMTRTTDVYPSLSDRYKLANKSNADAFLSVHFNSAAAPSATGIETLYSTKNSGNKAFAQSIQGQLIKETGERNRGLKLRNGLAVLRGTKGLSALAELGFINNPNDAKKIKTSSYLDKCATALANGIHNFLSR